MTKRRIIENENVDKELLDLTKWPDVRIESLSDEDQSTFLKRKKAILMYFESKTHTQIHKETGINRSQISIFLKKCLKFDQQGVLWGFRALIPHKRIDSYNRQSLPKSKQDNNNGAFQLLLETYPDLRELIDRHVFKQKNKAASELNTRTKHIHKKFIIKCRELGIAPPHYPFNTSEQGRRSLYRYVKELNFRSVPIYESTNQISLINRPFERVQFDGHKLDLSLAIVINTPEEVEVVKEINRIWLLTVMDVATRNILGYHISFNKEYNSSDVLRCIRNAIVPWQPKTFTISGLEYPKDGGFPSAVIPETQWAVWGEIFYDNARSNLSTIVQDRLKNVVGCAINAGPVESPLRRSIQERFYGILEENGFHLLPNTTGSNPNDSRRKDAAKQAIKYRISPEHIEELTEVLIAQYNGTPHEGISFLSPLEIMKEKVEQNPMIIDQISIEKRSEAAFMTLHAQRTINGNVKDKRRPYIQYENVRYTNPILSNSYGLIGMKLDLVVNTDDLRVIKAFYPDGSELGLLKASGKWGITPHTLLVRQEIFKMRHRKLMHFTNQDDAVQIYHNFLLENAKLNKKTRNKLAALEKSIRETTFYSNSNELKENDVIETNDEFNQKKQLREKKKKSKGSEIKKIRKTIFY
ncbi:hypothetical protein AJ85_16795 [Alkalihalobacillus alcalophilus ATCC 27647 = CGMCC 1.3604]|uniref:Integrase catalytic domain-containing protein n=1 Tax=Alkalihalobacillus alcalophilus ATCC 27647 = CGMCC 1.3604 TaxID=1218173 RepID=A0A094WHJ6_ALKAL|nr:hypothetical protein [Alkalihalobacillus alcalophilus]KGA96261.1 hypothetical protein BALCAV_0217255 [Alkalihalobacillus alcalophilus ATCC 27647 = CGMCC 1.3604]MED1563603.1 hypothetical protein [Alkalihalobacillus alcalophilus]THG89566.1 hypothetical protein AJ85_16795 [Alkalihalobacillus alcalophilus ATCC 27647 = CGMCC 1.3604]